MAKESSTKTPKALTKKHLARIEKEKRQNRILTIGIIIIVAVIAILVIASMFHTQIGDWWHSTFVSGKPVAKVGNSVITVEQFQNRVRFQRYQDVYQFEMYASSYFASMFQSYLLQMQNNLDNTLQYGSNVLDTMIEERAVMLKAQEMGITVTDAEVDKELQGQMGYYPSGTPTTTIPTATITYYPTSTLSDLQNTLTFNTPTALPPTSTPLSTDAQATLDAENLTATAQAAQPTPTIDLTPTVEPTITPTATVFTAEGYKSYYATVVANLNKNTGGFSESDLRDYFRAMLYEQKVYEQVSKTVAVEQDMVWARHILVKDEATAKEVLTKLKAGEDWNTLCATYSTDTSNNTKGGDLGWFTQGTMVAAFDKAAFSLPIGQISDPVQTDYGWHIIQVLGHETRQLTADELATAQKAAFTKFINDAKTKFGVTKYDIWAKNVPTEPTIPSEYRITSN